DLAAEAVLSTAAGAFRAGLAVFAAVFFATMNAAPSHIVILLANRAGTINRLQARGNGARRPPSAIHGQSLAGLHPLCPAHRQVIRYDPIAPYPARCAPPPSGSRPITG